MSGLDQPLLLANSNYHVGHQLSIRIAEERGYFQEEGFTDYVYECRGLIPGPLEPRGLALAIKEHGVDVATAVNVGAILAERLRGAELYVVGGWRFTSNMRLFGRKEIADLRELRGKRVGTREAGGIAQFFIANQLRRVGVDPYTEIEWVYDASYGYGNDPRHLDALRSGAVDAMASQPPMTDVLAQEGFPLLLDPTVIYPGGRPDKVVVATRRTVEERGDELRAFFRGNIRAFWDMRNAASFGYLEDLEGRLRAQTHNDDERRVRIVSSVEKTEGWNLPIHGTVVPETLERVVEELVLFGELDRALDVSDVLRQDAASAAYRELSSRPALRETHETARAAVEKYGF